MTYLDTKQKSSGTKRALGLYLNAVINVGLVHTYDFVNIQIESPRKDRSIYFPCDKITICTTAFELGLM
jgi:hypothetical protein